MTPQQVKVLNELSKGQPVPHYVFSSRLYVHNYTARINELRKLGYPIRQFKRRNRLNNMTSYYELGGSDA